ncbi:MAG: formylglycine-generating enzyme family protein [Bacteroidetes bacterium]|nr:formylglycine-generating enzyme family protein [Bacteroidota bacterium]
MPFRYIPAEGKTFMFQADDGSNLGTEREGIPIIFENNFWMCAYQTTQEFWATVIDASDSNELNANPSFFKGKTRPVEQVSWDDIQIFNKELNFLFKNEGLSVKDRPQIVGQFALPSETQWEYAANANQSLVFAGSQNLNDVAWYVENSNEQTMPVGLKQPNAWGLYDMSGNLWEWCADDYENDIRKIPKNGQPNLNYYHYKVLRGGSCFNLAEICRLRLRIRHHPDGRNFNDGGFRLVFSLSSAYES